MEAIRVSTQRKVHGMVLFFVAVAATLLLAAAAFGIRAWTSSSDTGAATPAIQQTHIAPAPLPDRSDVQAPVQKAAPNNYGRTTSPLTREYY